MKNYCLFVIALFIVLFSACRDEDLVVSEEDDDDIIDTADYADWTDATHGSSTEPNYDIVFNQNEVLRLDIEISSSDWTSMQSNLSSVVNSSSFDRTTQEVEVDDPEWFECSFSYDSLEWYHVGIRYKGNSSLVSAYSSGIDKLSLKIDFDQFEDDYSAITDQRFYGFQQLNLSNNYNDESLMREKVAPDLFRSFGLAAPQTAFCVVYIDHGSGSQYYGVYTIVEEVDDTVIETQFSSGTGNLYKPESDAATFASGTYNKSEMYLKTNEDSCDYADVKSLYTIINSSDRTSDVDGWKSDLEGVFDVDGFLKWLAANTVIQNWDTYGNMPHNYYLYNDPEDNLLTWIPWDNNEAFDGGDGDPLSLSMSEVDSDWPLIKYLINQDEYEEKYEAYLQQFIDEVFIPADLISTYSSYYDLLKDYAYAEESGYTFLESDNDFDSAVTKLKSHATTRNSAVASYLN
jgi:hypothetical protein